MKRIMTAAVTMVLGIATGFHPALAQISRETMKSIKTPDQTPDIAGHA